MTYIIYTLTTLHYVIKDHIFNILEFVVKLSSERARELMRYILVLVARLLYKSTTLPNVIKDHVFNIVDNVLFKICAGTIVKVRRLEQFM